MCAETTAFTEAEQALIDADVVRLRAGQVKIDATKAVMEASKALRDEQPDISTERVLDLLQEANDRAAAELGEDAPSIQNARLSLEITRDLAAEVERAEREPAPSPFFLSNGNGGGDLL
jgi:hypothetical protein